VLENLAFACPHCNRYKGPNIAGIDSQSDQLVRLYHPRIDDWVEHFPMGGQPIDGQYAGWACDGSGAGDERRRAAGIQDGAPPGRCVLFVRLGEHQRRPEGEESHSRKFSRWRRPQKWG